MTQRATSVRQVFEAMPGRFVPERAGDLNVTIQFDLSGDDGGQWTVSVSGGQVRVAEGAAANPTLVFRATADDYLALINGDLSPVQAFMQGKVQLTGDMSLALKMQSWFK